MKNECFNCLKKKFIHENYFNTLQKTLTYFSCQTLLDIRSKDGKLLLQFSFIQFFFLLF